MPLSLKAQTYLFIMKLKAGSQKNTHLLLPFEGKLEIRLIFKKMSAHSQDEKLHILIFSTLVTLVMIIHQQYVYVG